MIFLHPSAPFPSLCVSKRTASRQARSGVFFLAQPVMEVH